MFNVPWREITDNRHEYNHSLFSVTRNSTVKAREASGKNWVNDKGILIANTDMCVKRNKQDVLVVVGESWTYGDSLPGTKAVNRKDDPFFRINNNFAGHCARMLGTDLYLSAVPGCSNIDIASNLRNVLEEVADYKNIYVIIQVTSPGRDIMGNEWNNYNNCNATLFSTDSNTIPVDNYQWFKEYDTFIMSYYDDLIKQYPNAKALIWKNFNQVHSTLQSSKLSIVPTCWIEYTARVQNSFTPLPLCNEVTWWEGCFNKLTYFKDHSTEYINKELQKWIDGTQWLASSGLNPDWHPNPNSHLLWSTFILRHTDWIYV